MSLLKVDLEKISRMEHQANQCDNDIQKTKQRLGIGDGKVYEPEKVPERFAENLIKAGRTYIVGILK